MGIFNNLGFTIVYLICVSSLITADVCVKTGPCSCEFSNGTGIDLSPAVPATYYSAETFDKKMNGSYYELTTYFYHPCYDVMLNLTVPGDKANTCDSAVSMCRHVNIMNSTDATAKSFVLDAGRYEFLGSSNISQFSDQGDSIIYFNGPSKNIVLLECTKKDTSLHVSSLDEPNQLVLTLYSPEACLKQIGSTRSLGSTLLIIFFSMLVFYLALGICAKKFLMGATGIEVIPNLAFWSELPGLVRDGWLFAISGCKLPSRGAGPTITPDANTYDSI